MIRAFDPMEPGGVLYGRWDPGASGAHEWWETPKHQHVFMNAIRGILDLEPLQGAGALESCERCKRRHKRCEHWGR